MAVREIAKLGNPVLRKKCSRVANVKSVETRKIVQDLFDTLADFRAKNGFGRGIAAPQIGKSVRIFVIDVNGEQIAFINPRVTELSKTIMTLWDDCFSFPELMVKLHRHKSISLNYTDLNGVRQRFNATEALSELIQHEIDHLDGILSIDRAISSEAIILTSEYKKRIKRQLISTNSHHA